MPVYPSALSDQQIANKLTRDGLHWLDTTLTYSFNDSSTSGNVLDATHRLWINRAIDQIEEIFSLSFTEIASGGQITFSGQRFSGTYAGTQWWVPDQELFNTGIIFDQDPAEWSSNLSANLDYGSYGFTTILHEFLHGLGLEHPGDYNGVANYFPDAEFLQDTARYTVMSYFDADEDGSGTSHWFYNGVDFDWIYPQTLMIYDILAMTEGNFAGKFTGYGSNLTTRNTATIYGYNVSAGINEVYDFDSNGSPVLTIYDAGGTDTIDLSGDIISQTTIITYNSSGGSITNAEDRTTSVIDLREGEYSSTHGMTNNIGIAFGTVIENAVGTMFDDTMHGNNVANNLRGGAGDDTLKGWGGNDRLIGGVGGDVLDGGTGVDTVDYSGSTEGVKVRFIVNRLAEGGDAAGDTYVAIENAVGSNLRDYILGSSDANNLVGGLGNDQIIGGAGADRLDGGGGTGDHLNYYSSNAAVTVNLTTNMVSGGHATSDVISGFEWVTGSAFGDALTGSSAANRLYGRDSADTLTGMAGNDLLNGGTGHDTLTGGTGADIFVFTDAGFNQDKIMDWEDGIDKLDMRSLGLTFASFTESQSGANTVLTLISNNLHKITFMNTLTSEIDAGDFLV